MQMPARRQRGSPAETDGGGGAVAGGGGGGGGGGGLPRMRVGPEEELLADRLFANDVRRQASTWPVVKF